MPLSGLNTHAWQSQGLGGVYDVTFLQVVGAAICFFPSQQLLQPKRACQQRERSTWAHKNKELAKNKLKPNPNN